MITLELGDVVELLPPLTPGLAKLVALIPPGETPDPRNIDRWYRARQNHHMPRSIYYPIDSCRYVFWRGEGANGFVIVPERVLDSLTRSLEVEDANL